MNIILDKIRGCLYGGAVGDALGYPIEFYFEFQIFKHLGEKGIQSYVLDKLSKQAIISDDTQMTLFTAYGLLVGAVKKEIQESEKLPRHYISMAYQDWLHTQDMTFEESKEFCKESWLLDIPQLYSLRAPGNTCISALTMQKRAGRAGFGFRFDPDDHCYSSSIYPF